MDGATLMLPDNMVRLFGPEDLSSKIDTVVEIVARSADAADTRRDKARRWPSRQPGRQSFFEATTRPTDLVRFFEATTRPTDLVRFFEAETEYGAVEGNRDRLSQHRRVERSVPTPRRPARFKTPILGIATPTVLRPHGGNTEDV
jgi:hypothetical protein